jgi:POT family proton-dependent oligopeptide transporter
MMNNFVSQAGTMELHGIPNDIMQNINPLSVIIFLPVMDRIFYPFLRRMGIKFRPITRIFWGFMLISVALAYAAFVQNLIYSAGPCYKFPLQCDAAKVIDPITGKTTILHNRVHIAIQTPAYFLISISEIFASVTGLEYAYTKAPTNMKSFIMSMYMLVTAIGAIFGIALTPIAKDPKLVWLYSGISASTFVVGWVFWIKYRHLNKIEDALNQVSVANDEQSGHAFDGPSGLDPTFASRTESYMMSKLSTEETIDRQREGETTALP